MFSTNSVKKFDIQEANKHLQLLHKRNAELVNELDLKSCQLKKVTGHLSKVEAQLEGITKVKNTEVSQLTERLSDSESRLRDQTKETELWRMLVHERDVMIAKLQARCRGLEELEGRLYECRPSLEALLGLIYDFDGGSEGDSQNKGGPIKVEESEEADYAAPDMADPPPGPPAPNPSKPKPPSSKHTLPAAQHTAPTKHSLLPAHSAPYTPNDRVKHFLMNSVAECEKLNGKEQTREETDKSHCTHQPTNVVRPESLSAHPAPLPSHPAPYTPDDKVKHFLMNSVAEYEEINASMSKDISGKQNGHGAEEDLCNNFFSNSTFLGKAFTKGVRQQNQDTLPQQSRPTENVLTKSNADLVQETYPIVDL